MTTKVELLEIRNRFPDASFMELARMTGRCRKTIAAWLRGGVTPARRKWYRQWQKNRISETKTRLIKLLGGKCVVCGYDKCDAALDFHHRDPNKKDDMVSRLLMGSFEKARVEALKCDLICCRCHRELHAKES